MCVILLSNHLLLDPTVLVSLKNELLSKEIKREEINGGFALTVDTENGLV